MSPKDACLDALKRVARNYDNDSARLAQFDLSFYAIRKDGEYAGASLWNGSIQRGVVEPRRFAINDGGKSRLESCIYLLERKMG